MKSNTEKGNLFGFIPLVNSTQIRAQNEGSGEHWFKSEMPGLFQMKTGLNRKIDLFVCD